MATEISVTGNKKIATLQKEFNEKFPYLRIGIFPITAKATVAKGGTINQLSGDMTIAKVRTKTAPGDISISGNKLISSLEKEFETIFGLYAQVCYTEKDGGRYYTSGYADSMTLSAFNKKCEANGCKKDVCR